MLPLAGDTASDLVVSGPLLVALLIALAAGALSFFSPCCLPLVPGYLSYVAGVSGAEHRAATTTPAPSAPEPVRVASGATATATVATLTAGERPRSRSVVGALLFILGFAVVFTSYGALFGAVGGWLLTYQGVVVRVLGVITIALGLMFMGIVRLPVLGGTFRLEYQPRAGLAGAPLLGVMFGLGWTPCIGPTLAAVLTLAATSAGAARGAALSFAYSWGLGLPFLVAAMSAQRALASFGWARRHALTLMRGGGAMLVLLGVLQVSGWWRYLMAPLQTLVANWTVPL